MANAKYKHNIIAIVYDFDGTLTPQPMQEYTVLPEIGIEDGMVFWEEVARESKRTKGEGIVTYMRLMLEKSRAARFPVKADKLARLAAKIKYYPGVSTYFGRINSYVQKAFPGVVLRHYVISAGLKEIISGANIAKYFHRVFACEYYYDEYDAAVFPNVIVNDTLKTQFIFRINKGREELHQDINSHMAMAERPIPFQNILYIGDGMTDVPCMTVIRKNGGYAIAVFKKSKANGKQICQELLHAKRVDFIAAADYRSDSELVRLIKLLLQNMVAGIKYGKESFEQTRRYLKPRRS